MIQYVIAPFHGLALARHFSLYSAAIFSAECLDEALLYDEKDERLFAMGMSGVHLKYFDPFVAIAQTPLKDYGLTAVEFTFDSKTATLASRIDATRLAPSGYLAFEVEDETSFIQTAPDNDARLDGILRYVERVLDALCLSLQRDDVPPGSCEVGYLTTDIVGAWVGSEEKIELIARSATPLRRETAQNPPRLKFSEMHTLYFSYGFREMVTPSLSFHLADKAWLNIFDALHRFREINRIASDEARFLSFASFAEDLTRLAHSLEKEPLMERVAELADFGLSSPIVENWDEVVKTLWQSVREPLQTGKTFAELGRDKTQDLALMRAIVMNEIGGLHQQKLVDDLLS